MEETLASQKMAKVDLINSLEKISSEIPDRILKIEGYKSYRPSPNFCRCDERVRKIIFS